MTYLRTSQIIVADYWCILLMLIFPLLQVSVHVKSIARREKREREKKAVSRLIRHWYISLFGKIHATLLTYDRDFSREITAEFISRICRARQGLSFRGGSFRSGTFYLPNRGGIYHVTANDSLPVSPYELSIRVWVMRLFFIIAPAIDVLQLRP